MQKREGVEKPIAFFSRIIRDGALKYNIIEKKALALVKALKDFRVYILHSHILAYVPNAAVKDILVQANPEGRRGKWIASLLEYDVEIKPTKLIRGQGLAKLMAETNLQVLDINLIAAMSDEDEENSSVQWGLDFIGEIHPASSGQHRWILTATNYFTKWIEAIPTRQATDATVFPTSLAVPVVKLLQEAGSEEDPMQRRINQMIHLQQTREEVFQNTCKLQERIKKIYDRKAKADTLQLDEVVLRWDARHEDKGKHGKFENLWKGPYNIAAYRGQNAFLLKEINGDECPGGPINGWLLKRYYF
eukprot:PITA_11343